MFGLKRRERESFDQPPIQIHEVNIMSFGGRISRGMFWKRILLSTLIFGVAEFVIWTVGNSTDELPPMAAVLLGILVAAYIFFLGIQGVKRLHDLDKPAWMILPNLTGVLIPISLIWLGCVPGTHGTNRYGFDPVEDERGMPDV